MLNQLKSAGIKFKHFLNWFFSPTHADQLVLLALQKRPKNGLELADVTGYSLGKIYVVLNRLEKRGLIVGHWEETPYPERGEARRRYYILKVLIDYTPTAIS